MPRLTQRRRTFRTAHWPPRRSRGHRAILAKQARSRPGRRVPPSDPSCSGGATGRARKRPGSDRSRLPYRPARWYSETLYRLRDPPSLCRLCVTRSCQRSLCKEMACDHPSLSAHTRPHLLSNDWTSDPVKRQMHPTRPWLILRRDMNENISLGRIFGIHVGFNWSLLVVAALIAWSLATGILPPAVPGETSSAYWTAGVVSAFVFLASLLAHELAHSVVAVRRGVKVEGLTLWLFGGVSRFSSETNSPGSQALITFVGPLTSLVLGVVFYLVAVAVGVSAHPSLVAVTLSWLGYIHISLRVFNL